MEKRFGDIAEFINGRAFKPEDWGTKGLPIIRIQNLTGTNEVFNYYEGEFDKRYLVKNDDILISWSASLGVYRWDKEDAVLNQHIFKVNLKNGIDKTYFYYAVQEKLIEMGQQVHGSTMKHITKDKFDNLKISVPDLQTQQKIASILEQADAARQKRKQANQLTEQFLQSAFLEMFGDPVRNEKGWKQMRLIDSVSIKGGGTPSKSKPEYFTGDIPWVSPKDMKSKFIYTSQDKITKQAVAESATNLIPRNAVLVVVRSGILKNTLPLAINVVDVTINQDMKAFICNKDLNPFFLLFQLQTLTDYILQFVRATTADNISSDVLKNINLIFPPLPLQQKFASIVVKVEQLRVKQRESEKELENLFQSLMQRYFGN